MSKNLVIVESPAKAKTIEGFLGKDYEVKSCYGHVRDLSKESNGVEIEKDFSPIYLVPDDKKAVVRELKKSAKSAEVIWIASDEDREGEAIAWHLSEVLDVNKEKLRRIIFHEITKPAITNAIKTPRDINQNVVNAQQARRILDRLVGFELSPILWRKVKPSLSAGRVQSVAVRLVVDREREIDAFTPVSQYKVIANFVIEGQNGEKYKLKAELPKKFKDKTEAEEFLKKCIGADFTINSLEKKPVKKSPSAPFTTSTLQQEASRKLRYSVAKTMLIAQKLYEAGKITYMRTDSVNLSELAIDAAKSEISSKYGAEYSNPKQYKTKSSGAQEAHEAIRPTYFEKQNVDGSSDEKALYELIWKRTIASQMSDAIIERTIVKINISSTSEKFTAQGEIILFDGFLKVYLESSDDENGEAVDTGLLPPVKEGEKLNLDQIIATERFSRASARFTEASLVKKLEELGIGRPSTYAPTISTVQKRGYVVKEERMGKERNYNVLTLSSGGDISDEIKTEITGAEKGKLYPTDIALLVNDFLLQHFPQIMDFQFTANVEGDLDNIADGKLNWSSMLKEFYHPFHDKVEDTIENSERVTGERILGTHPTNGKQLSVRMARFGPVAQITNLDDEDEKPEYAGLRVGQKLESITFEEALELFKLPRTVGEFEEEEVVAAIGRFGPYLRHKGKFVSLKKEYDPHTVDIVEAIVVIEEKRKKDAEKLIKVFEEDENIQILNGRWGPYVTGGKKMNVRIPKDVEPKSLTFEDCVKMLEEVKDKAPAKKTKAKKETKSKKAPAKKKAASKTKKGTAKKKTTAKKTTTKKATATKKDSKEK